MKSTLLNVMNERVLFLDGAMGTQVHSLNLPLSDYDGHENCSEILNLTRPDVIRQIHESFLAVGADVIETNTFGGMSHVLAEFGLDDRVDEIARAAVTVACSAVEKINSPDRPRFVLGSMGPGTKLITLEQISYDQLFDSYRVLARALMEGGPGESVDGILIETCQDLLQIKAVVDAVRRAQEQLDLWGTDHQRPIFVSITIEQNGKMLVGSDVSAAVTAISELPVACLGMNCATGPKEMAQHLQYLSRHCAVPISVFPNAGLPRLVEGETVFPLQPEAMAEQLADLVETAGVNLVGGCCGTTPEHIKAMVERIGIRAPAPRSPRRIPAVSSLYQAVEYRQENSLLNVSERCNASGSRKFRELLEQEKWDEMVSVARQQVREGSHVIDVNVDYAGRDNAADMAYLAGLLVRQVDAPLMLDSTQPATIEAGLKKAGGKCLINSANLEDGREKFATMCGLARRYGAGLVLGTIDEDPEEAMARTADRKLAIAERMYALATEQYGLQPADLMFDPLVLPISTGMDKDRRSALETIEGVGRIARRFPQCQVIAGLSNVSFGLKPATRQVLNSVFLHELAEAGATSVILHISKILPRHRVPDEQWNVAMDLIYDRRRGPDHPDGPYDPLQTFIDLFSEDAKAVTSRKTIADLPLEERLQRHVVDGEKKHLIDTLEEARQQYTPLEIVNDHLLAGMKVVGELFGSGQMQLPFVLQSAEVMKMAVTHLEQYMEKLEGTSKGSIVLATVKGDVHDIGKNLVDIILTNNGYTVYNIGIKQPVSAVLDAWRERKPDAIGLSGLLVKSVNAMGEYLREMVNCGLTVPVLLGGAALSRHYCESHLRPIYTDGGGKVYHGTNAFEGLRIMNKLAVGELTDLDDEIEKRLDRRAESEAKNASTSAAAAKAPSATVDIPSPPFWLDRVVDDLDLNDIYPFINKVALYRGQWGFKKGKMSDERYETFLRDEVAPIFERLCRRCRDEGILKPQVVYGYYPCNSEGPDLIIYDPTDPDKEIERFSWPRQKSAKRLCVSDFFRNVECGEKDVIGMHCVTMGRRISEITRALFDGDDYREYLYLHGMGVECAEALAEFWHKRMRRELGIDNDDAADVRGLFAQKYRGSRYSFGYPAVPEISDQQKLFRLLKPDRIGCVLTENWQIDPEQSTSAIIVHHPEAKYFSV